MTASELQALRKFLMLDIPEAARIIGGVSERTWRYWEAGRSPVPVDVEDKLTGMLSERQRVIEQYEAEAMTHCESPVDEEAERLQLPYYPTLEAYQSKHQQAGALMWRCYQSAVAELYANNLIGLTNG